MWLVRYSGTFLNLPASCFRFYIMYMCIQTLFAILIFFPSLLLIWIHLVGTQTSFLFIRNLTAPMAPTAFLAPTPISRRTRRKQQKDRRRAGPAQNGTGLWKQGKSKTNQHQDWLKTLISPEPNDVAAPTSSKAMKFKPKLRSNCYPSESHPQASITRANDNSHESILAS